MFNAIDACIFHFESVRSQIDQNIYFMLNKMSKVLQKLTSLNEESLSAKIKKITAAFISPATAYRCFL